MSTSMLENKIIPLKGMRGMIAANMRSSLDEAAQLTHIAECDATALMDFKKKVSESRGKVSVEDIVADCLVSCLKAFPGLNGRVEKDAIHLSKGVHLSYAVALKDNLLVAPTLFDAEGYDLVSRALQRKDLVARAQAGKLTVTEMTKGTFTITNLGLTRVRFFTPIINRPQIAILGIGEMTDQVYLRDDGSISTRKAMGLSLTFDHRAVDGSPAAEFLSHLCETIESLK